MPHLSESFRRIVELRLASLDDASVDINRLQDTVRGLQQQQVSGCMRVAMCQAIRAGDLASATAIAELPENRHNLINLPVIMRVISRQYREQPSAELATWTLRQLGAMQRPMIPYSVALVVEMLA